jgi:hypothetical protein
MIGIGLAAGKLDVHPAQNVAPSHGVSPPLL